jgi:hypothetical protein
VRKGGMTTLSHPQRHCRCLFSSPKPKNRHFDPKLLTLLVSSAAEKSASLPGALPKATHSIVLTSAAIFFGIFCPKIACQAPKSPNSLLIIDIRLAC